ncbi:biotin-dependent carboxyltransferase family protein [Cytobacillus sp. IB215316]|uniref:5-oxoprolinase subunit C family protein n=1 Tax=Cytobacillus sp. IB215316 TaxID=3097354 RepID=UPI002A0BFF56|nr:biotin-dependent carboxyltransferase family protein [Cytobacillus sp. IB215316]MDX8362893.1 biotin-dependent carboxyltransferase family protein [Cytobacillus sp. IB215316]
MGKPIFFVKKKGLFTTYQDLGRYGYQKYGVPVSGAMDQLALKVGNLLVGNSIREAGIEITMLGPLLIAENKCLIAITGAHLGAKINGKPAPLWKAFLLNKGDELSFSGPQKGMRAYITVAGGFDVRTVMGSKSTYEKADIGQAIDDGDIIKCNNSYEEHTKSKLHQNGNVIRNHWLATHTVPTYGKHIVARIISSPHREQFTSTSLKTFAQTTYTVKQADRMGYRLTSPSPIEHNIGADIISEPIPVGTIQIPASGQPIILMSDRQTIGGYTTIGTVITADIPKIGQLPSGGTIRFQVVTVDVAHMLIKEERTMLAQIALGVTGCGAQALALINE